MKGSLLTLISLKNKEDIKRYAESVDDQDVKECVNKLMILNENTIKSFWNLTPEQENRMMRKTRENIIKERSETKGIQKGRNIGMTEGINKEKLAVAKKLAQMHLGIDVIRNATGLSKEKIKKLYEEN